MSRREYPYRLPSGRWLVRWRADGHHHSRTFATRREAKLFLSTVRVDRARGEYIDPALGRRRFDEWAAEVAAARADRRLSTVTRDETLIRRLVLPTFGHMPLAGVGQIQVQQWVAMLNASGYAPATTRKPYAPATTRKAFELMAGIMARAVTAGLIVRSPCRGIDLPKLEHTEMRFLSAAEVGDLADAIDPRYRALVLVAAYGGLRFGELAALRVSRVDPLRKTVRVEETLNEVRGHIVIGPPKTRAARRTVTLPTFVAHALAEHLNAFPPGDGGLVFTSPEGMPLRRNAFRPRVWVPATRAAGLPHSFARGQADGFCTCGLAEDSPTHERPLRTHDLRHTHVALLIGQGAHVKVIAQRLGHTSVRTVLDVYGHLFEGLDEAAADALDVAYRDAPAETNRGAVVEIGGR